MATATVIERKGDLEMTNAAKFALHNIVHFKMLGGLFLNIEDIRMAVGTVEPQVVRFVRENGRRGSRPPRFKAKLFVEVKGFVVFVNKALLRMNKLFIHGIDPIDPIAKSGPWQPTKLGKCRFAKSGRAAVAFLTMLTGMAKGDLTIMTGAAIVPLKVLPLGDLRGVYKHLEAKLQVTNPAGVEQPMGQMGKTHGL